MIWAPGVSGADITDYHIDALARFMQPGVVLIQLPGELDEEDPWSKSANETYDALSAIRLPNGEGLELVIIPEPNTTRVKSDGFVSSYVNYYVCNGAVIAAEFGESNIVPVLKTHIDVESDSQKQVNPEKAGSKKEQVLAGTASGAGNTENAQGES